MNYLLSGGIILYKIVFIILCILKRDKLIWNTILCISALPLIFVITFALGWLPKDKLPYGIVYSIALFFAHWYYYIPALIVFIISLYKIIINEKTKEM